MGTKTIFLLLAIASPLMVTASWPAGLKEFLSRNDLFSAVALGTYRISSNLPAECEEIRTNHYSVKMEAKAKISELGMNSVKVTVEFYVLVCRNVQGDDFIIYYVGDLHCPQYHLRHAMMSTLRKELNTEYELSFGGSTIPESKLKKSSSLAAKLQDNWKYELLETFNLKSKNIEFKASSYMISKTGKEPEYFGAMFKKTKKGMNTESLKFIPYELNSAKTQISNKYSIVPFIPVWISHTRGREEEDPYILAALLSLFTYRFAKPIISWNIITKTSLPDISLYSELWILEIEYENDKETTKPCFVATLPKGIGNLPPILGEPVVGDTDKLQKQGLAVGNYTANAIMDFDHIDTSFDPDVRAGIWTSINNLLFSRFEVHGSFEYTFTGISGILSANASLKEYVWIFKLEKAPSDSIRAKHFGVLIQLCNLTKKLDAVAIGHFCRSIVTIRSTPRRKFFSKGLQNVESFGANLIVSQEEPSKGLIGDYLSKLKKNTEGARNSFKRSMENRFPEGNFESIPPRSCYGTLTADYETELSEFMVFEVLQKYGLKRYFVMELVPNEEEAWGYNRLIKPRDFGTSDEAEDYASQDALAAAPTFANF